MPLDSANHYFVSFCCMLKGPFFIILSCHVSWSPCRQRYLSYLVTKVGILSFIFCALIWLFLFLSFFIFFLLASMVQRWATIVSLYQTWPTICRGSLLLAHWTGLTRGWGMLHRSCHQPCWTRCFYWQSCCRARWNHLRDSPTYERCHGCSGSYVSISLISILVSFFA